MRVISPLVITDDNLTSTSVAEPAGGETEYDAGHTYATGDFAIDVTQHRKYRSLSSGNVGNPLPVLPETETAFWIDVGPTLAWAMFDLDRNTKTTGSSPLVVVITPGAKVNSVAFMGVLADEVTISEMVGATVVHSETISLVTRTVAGWYDWFTAPFTTRANVVRHDLTARTAAVFTFTFTRTTGDVSAGALVPGNYRYLGRIQHGAEADKLNFSKITRDDDGNSLLTRKATKPKTTQNVRCSKGMVPTILAAQDEFNAVPAVWSGIDDQDSGYFEPLLILGIYKRWTINLDQPNDALQAIELEEV